MVRRYGVLILVNTVFSFLEEYHIYPKCRITLLFTILVLKMNKSILLSVDMSNKLLGQVVPSIGSLTNLLVVKM